MIYDHSLADLDIGGNGIRARYLECCPRHLLDQLATELLRASDGKTALALAELISSNQPRIVSGRERVRLGPIENALSLCLLPFKQGRGSLRSRAVGRAPQRPRALRLYQR
jgi:hypothetical protein